MSEFMTILKQFIGNFVMTTTVKLFEMPTFRCYHGVKTLVQSSMALTIKHSRFKVFVDTDTYLLWLGCQTRRVIYWLRLVIE